MIWFWNGSLTRLQMVYLNSWLGLNQWRFNFFLFVSFTNTDFYINLQSKFLFWIIQINTHSTHIDLMVLSSLFYSTKMPLPSPSSLESWNHGVVFIFGCCVLHRFLLLYHPLWVKTHPLGTRVRLAFVSFFSPIRFSILFFPSDSIYIFFFILFSNKLFLFLFPSALNLSLPSCIS